MKPDWQRQQEILRQQQEQMVRQQQQQQDRLRKQQMAAWYQQQQQEKNKGIADPKQPPLIQPAAPAAGSSFLKVEREVAELRSQLAQGRLTEDQVRARLQELVIQDQNGQWWSIGYETGDWYHYTDGGWVRVGRFSAANQPAAAGKDGSKNSTLAALSFGIAILSWFVLPFIGGLGAILLGNAARKQIKESGGAMTGDGTAKTGLVLGWLNFLVFGASLCLLLLYNLNIIQ